MATRHRTYQDMMQEMMGKLEVDMYGTSPQQRLCKMLHKLGIKSAAPQPLMIESLSAVLTATAWKDSVLINWKDLMKKVDDES